MTHAPRVAALAAALTALVAASQAGAQQAGGGAGAGVNGELPPEQFKARCRQVFLRADVDHDGRITRKEWDEAAARIRKWLAAHNRTLPGTPDKIFDMIDVDHNGAITPPEIDAACARMAAKSAPAVQ